MVSFDIRSIVVRIIAVALGFGLHEAAHAAMTTMLGDPTAKQQGRLTINPLAHVDWMGLVCLFLFGFGWGKPVQINPRYYKDPKSGMVWTAFAGPLMNFVLTFVCIFLFYLMYKISYAFVLSGVGSFICDALLQTAYVSLGMGIFNCIPVPPLDGSKILFSILPEDTYFKITQGSMVLSIAFIVLLYTGILTGPMNTLSTNIIQLFSTICGALLGM